MLSSVPLNVKFPSSSISPPAPTITTLLSVKSSTFTDASVDWSSTLRVENICTAPLINVLPVTRFTLKCSCAPIIKSLPVYLKYWSSSTSPPIPAIKILSFVKSSTFKDASVDCPSISNVPEPDILPSTLNNPPSHVN